MSNSNSSKQYTQMLDDFFQTDDLNKILTQNPEENNIPVKKNKENISLKKEVRKKETHSVQNVMEIPLKHTVLTHILEKIEQPQLTKHTQWIKIPEQLYTAMFEVLSIEKLQNDPMMDMTMFIKKILKMYIKDQMD